MSISDASTQVFGSKKAVAFFQSLLIVLALGAWVLPERAFSQEVTVELADTASVPGGIAVVPFIFAGMEISAEFTGQVQFSEPPLSIRTLDLCVPDDPGSIACEEFDSGSISIFIDPDSGLLPNFTGYLIFNVDSDADLGATPVGWSQTDAEPFTVIEFDGVVSILSSAELQVSALPSFVDFGEVEVFTDDFLGVEICGTNDQEGPVWIVDAQADNENFFVEPDGGTCPSEFPFDISGESGGCCIMEVRFSPDGETEFSSQLEIFSSVGQSVIPLSGEGIPEGDFLPVLLPESHDFGSLPANTPAFHDFVLTNEGSQTGAIDALFISGDEEFSIVSQDCIIGSPPSILPPGDQCTIEVEFFVTDAIPKPQSFSGDLIIETSEGILSAELTGIAQSSDEADLTLSPASRDFGLVATRTFLTQVFEVLNEGTGTGAINDIFINGDSDEFTIVSSTCLNGSPPAFLEPGDSCDITVQFFVDAVLVEPTDFAAELVVDTDDGDLVAPLSGTAQTFDPIFSDRFDIEFLPMPRGLSFMAPRGGGSPICSLFNWSFSVGLFDSDTGNQGPDNRRYSGPCGLRVPLDGAVRLVGDQSPILESQYLATFYAFFDDVIDGAVMFFEAAGVEQPRVQLMYADGGIIFSVFDNDGNEVFEIIPDIGSGWHSFSLDWESGSNAEVALSISGAPDVIIEVDNSNHRIEEVYLGNLEPDFGATGSIDLDAFVSRRLTRPDRLLVGDANGDGVIDVADLRAVDREISPSLQIIANGQPDCNEDGVIDEQDLECLGAIVAADQPIDFALDEVTAMPGESIELAGLLNDNPFDAISISVVISIDTEILSFGTGGISCGRVVRGAALTDEHTLICGTSGDEITTVAVVGTASTLPEGELFRLLLDVNPNADFGGETAVVIDDVEIDLSGLLAPSTMYTLSDGLVRTPDPVADLVLDPTFHDFGDVEPQDFPISRDFSLTNQGDSGSLADIELVNLVGNAAFSLAADNCTDNTLGAGESCTVTVLFDAGDLLPGKYSTALEFTANPPVAPALITGTRAGIVDFDILPGSVDFGTLTEGDGAVSQSLELINIGELPLDLANVSFEISGSTAFEITDNACDPSLSLNPGEFCTIELAFFGGDQAPGSYTGFFQASSDSSSVTVNLFGETEAAPPEAALSVNPTARNFGQLGIADFPVTQLFTVTNSGEPGSVASISNAALTGSPLFSLTSNNCPGAALAAGQSCTFTVSFDASDAPPNTYAASVQIVSDAGNPAVSLSGTRVPSEINLSVNPLSHDFGSLSADDLPATQRFTVLASGDPGLDIAITGVALSEDDAFAVTEDNCSGAELSNTQTCLVEVSFNPSALAPGNYTATLEIVSDESLLIPLSGQLAVTAPQPDIFVLPAPTNQRPGVASFVGELSSSGVGNAVAAAGRIGPAATTRFLVSAPAEGAVYLIADGNFNAPARGIDSDPDATIRFQVSGPTPFGISQAGDGDFRASGHSTIALGDSLAGRVVLLFGSADTPPGATAIDLTEVTGSGAELDAGFETIVISGSDLMTQGFELAFIGDFNGNGHDDLAIGLPDYGSAGQGRVYVVFGNASDDNVNLDALEPDQGIIIDGTTTDGALGFSVAGAGDFNGSGFADLVIGAPFSSDYGRVVVVFGNDEPASLSVSALDGSNGFIARMPVESSAGPRFGYSVAGAGDFDGDGFNDIIVGAPRSMLLDQPSLPGQARILFGQASVESGTVLIDDHDRLRQLAINPFSIGNNSMFGFSVAGLGDSSRNGFSDVAIGDPGYGDPVNNPALPRFTGQAYAVFGRTDPPTSLIAEELESDQASVYRPQQPSVRAGWAVAGIGDFSGDGFPDLLVTGPGASTSGLSNAGQIWAVGGRETAVVIDPEIDAIDPATGLVTGGETVTIFGRHFLEGVEVWFGEQPCLEVERIDHSQLRCLTPPTGASITDVSVINPDGTGVTLEEAFRFLDPTSLEVTAASFPGQFGQTGRLAEFEVFNSGDFAAEQLTLTISTNGADILDWFSLAPQCTVEGQVAICDFSEVAPWQCSISDNQATCMLGLLPAEGRAAVMLDFSGSGPVPTSLNLSSINADSIATNAELFGDN